MLSNRVLLQAVCCTGAIAFLTLEARAADAVAPYANPVFAGQMPDPGVMQYDGRYFAVGTTGNKRLPDGRIFRLITSTDLANWNEIGGALQPPHDDPSLEYWAPELAYSDGVFYLYYSVGTLADLHFEIRVATSERPEGPYVDVGEPLREGESAPFFIDGHPFQDDDGQWYFFYAKDFPNESDGCRAGTGIVVDRLIDMVRLEGKPKLVVRPRYEWTLFEANRKMDSYGGQVFDWHTIEAPWVVKHDGKYYCFYSGSNFGTINYGLDYVVADRVDGPYANQGRFARVLRGVPNLVRGPGHHSIVRSPNGKTDMIIYHAWNAAMTERQMCIDPLAWTVLGPRCAGPTVAAGSSDTTTSVE
ncbi:MAG: glycoside hydrolase family 43 protein [Planctomycetales bacterium]|nr:glycoside hydrolase family 43 protein [Planctomycetales bacterium]